MDKQQIMQQSQIGRNEPYPCGSGKKYKKCCMPKDEEKERLKREMENTTELTDEYFSTKDYIEESDYPITMFDLLLLEILNIIGEILQAYHQLNTLETKGILSVMLKKAKSFYSECRRCKYACLSHPMRTISFDSLIEKGLRIEQVPMLLQKPFSVNFFYLEFTNSIAWYISDELSRYIPKTKVEHIATTVHRTLFDYIAENCWATCDNKCLKEHSKNAYCSLCNFGTKSLPCPRKGEITYAEIKAKEEDMMH